MLDIIHSTLLCGGQRFPDSYVRISGRTITKTGPMRLWLPVEKGHIIDAKNTFLCPGFIDIHNHGAMMADTMDASYEAFDKISKYHLENGVTSYLLTTMTAPLEDIQKVFDALRQYRGKIPVNILGIHMEGPFLSPDAAGAHPCRYLQLPDDKTLDFIRRNKDFLKLITVAPELPHMDRLLALCRENHIVISGGHDSAVDDEIFPAIEAGLSSVTHIYCCSSTISRRPGSLTKHLGLTQIGLSHSDLFCEVIADNCHIPDNLFKLIYRCKGFKKICLISDGLSASGLAPGNYYLGTKENGVEVIVNEKVALLKNKKAFAGSITPISHMVARLIGRLGILPEEAVYMASSAPAKLLHLKHKGRIEAGCDAELNLMDKNGKLLKTIIGENFIYSHKEDFL